MRGLGRRWSRTDEWYAWREDPATRIRPHARVLFGGEPKIGAHGKPVLFLHPKDFNGTLIELEQA